MLLSRKIRHQKKTLYERISALANDGKLTQRTAKAATTIRLWGNSSAHDTDIEVDREYAEIIVQILDSLLDVYSYLALVDRAIAYIKSKDIL